MTPRRSCSNTATSSTRRTAASAASPSTSRLHAVVDWRCALISTADVVLENYGAGVIEKLGLTYDILSELNPRLIMLRRPGFGFIRPGSALPHLRQHHRRHVWPHLAHGLPGWPADDDEQRLRRPRQRLARHRRCAIRACRTRNETAAADRSNARSSKASCRLSATPSLPSRSPENSRRGWKRTARARAVRSVPCAGEDQWVAIDVETDAQWSALARAIAEPWATDRRARDRRGRTARREVLIKNLSAWTASRDRDDIAELCAAAGVPSARSITSPRCFSPTRSPPASGRAKSASTWATTSTR